MQRVWGPSCGAKGLSFSKLKVHDSGVATARAGVAIVWVPASRDCEVGNVDPCAQAGWVCGVGFEGRGDLIP